MPLPNTNLPENAVWVVTGTSFGFGLSLLSSVLSTPGYRIAVLACDLSIICLPPTSNESNTLLQPVDLASSASIANAFKAVLDKFQRVDVVVSNTECGFLAKLEFLSEGQARELLEINFWAPVQITRHAVSIMRNTNPKTGAIGGVIARISSCREYLSIPESSPCVASKTALEAFTEVLSKGVEPEWNIRFAIIEPESMKTKWFPTSMTSECNQYRAHMRRSSETDKAFRSHAKLTTATLKEEKGASGANQIARLLVRSDTSAMAELEALEDIMYDKSTCLASMPSTL